MLYVDTPPLRPEWKSVCFDQGCVRIDFGKFDYDKSEKEI